MSSPPVKQVTLTQGRSDPPLAKLRDELRHQQKDRSGDDEERQLLLRENQALRKRVEALSQQLRALTGRQRSNDVEREEPSRGLGERAQVWRELLRRLERLTRAGVWCRDLETGEVLWSEQLYALYGFEPGEVEPSSEALATVLDPDEMSRWRAIVAECAAQPGQLVRDLLRLRRRDGQVCELICTIERVEGFENGRPCLLGTVSDVSHWDMLSDVQRHAEALERVQRLGRLGCWFRDLETGTLEWSPALRNMLGIERDAPADDELLLQRVHPEDRERIRAVYQEMQHSGARSRARCRVVLPDGRERWVLLDMGAEFDGEKPTAWIGALVDITEQQQLADELRLSQQREVVGRLAAGVVHDVSNLVQIIELEARSIADAADKPDLVREHASAILEVNRRAQVFIRRLLSLRDRARYNPMGVDVQRQLGRLQSLLALALGSRNRLHTEWGASTRVMFDPTQLEQVIINLVMNARDASEPGSPVYLSTQVLRLQEGDAPPLPGMASGEYCVINVRDEGKGMAPELQQRAFEPFFTTKGDRGTGLGLATVKELVRQYHGHLKLESEPGRGTTFRIYLPTEDTTRRQKQAKTTPSHSLQDSTQGRVLIVDDDVAMGSAIRDTLAQAGYDALAVESAERALNVLVRDDTFALVLTDVVMQDMDGIELAHRLRKRKADLPILFMTGYVEGVRERLPEASRTLTKPFGPQELFSAVREMVKPTPTAQPSQ